MMSTRPLNSLEAIFASCNVRFALLVVMDTHHIGGDIDAVTAELQKNSTDALRACVLGHLAVKKMKQEEWSLVATNEADTKVTTRELSIGKDYGKFLHELVHQDTVPAEGPLRVQIIKDSTEENNDTRVIGLLVNSNHAMVDGRSLTRLVYLATKPSESSGNSVAYRTPKLQDWREIVEHHLVRQEESWTNEPPYLLQQHDILSMKEMCRKHSSDGSDYFAFNLSDDTVNKLRALLKEHTQGGATMSGFLAAIILQSLAQEYGHGDPRALALSMLVDLRAHVALEEGVVLEEIPQLHGSVNVVESTNRLLQPEAATDSKTSSLTCNLWNLSTNLTRQLKKRIERGEAHRNALALTSGRFDQAGLPATLELSNLGVCQLPDEAKMFTSQRFDGYDGVSCMVHSESSTGIMRWNVSVGEGLDADMIRLVFQRAFGRCLDLVAEP